MPIVFRYVFNHSFLHSFARQALHCQIHYRRHCSYYYRRHHFRCDLSTFHHLTALFASPVLETPCILIHTLCKQVICEKVEKSDIATIDKKKYLVPADLTVGQFVYVIRKRIKLSPEKAIFIFVDEVLPPTAALMSSIYEEHKDEDGYVSPLFTSFPSFYPISAHANKTALI